MQKITISIFAATLCAALLVSLVAPGLASSGGPGSTLLRAAALTSHHSFKATQRNFSPLGGLVAQSALTPVSWQSSLVTGLPTLAALLFGLSSLKLTKHSPIASLSRRRQGTQTFAFCNQDILPQYTGVSSVLRDTSGTLEEGDGPEEFVARARDKYVPGLATVIAQD